MGPETAYWILPQEKGLGQGNGGGPTQVQTAGHESLCWPAERWIRVLPNECIRRLCPVFFPSNGSEYILALSSGKNKGFVHLGTIRGKAQGELNPRDPSRPTQLQG